MNLRPLILIAALAAATGAVAPSTSPIILPATGGLPAHVVGKFRDPIAFAVAKTGEYLVLDSRAHTVYVIDRSGEKVRNTLQIGLEQGKVLSPGALSLAANDIFAVADAPNRFERIQYFTLAGETLGAFYLPTRSAPRLAVGLRVLNGVGSMAFTGQTFLVSQPESGALISELNTTGAVIRQIGTLRSTGHEGNRDLHLARNVGLPLVDPTGGFYFVFQTGVPAFRKYSAEGKLLYERHIEGIELDKAIQSLPTTWPTRSTEAGNLPLVLPLVRTATVDPGGRLWVSLIEPFTYVYAEGGDKQRTVQFLGASALHVTSLFFATPKRLLATPGCYEFTVEF